MLCGSLNKVVVASDSFKGSLTSMQVAQSVERAVCEVYPSCKVVKVRVADGGEGTMEALQHTLGGCWQRLTVSDPLGRPVDASYLILEDGITAVVEMSAASGLPLLKPEERDPSQTSTIGTGQIIRDALDKGCRRFLVGIGGSATNDAGMGMLHALGYRFKDASGAELVPAGGSMIKVASIDAAGRHPALAEAEFIVACDVKAPLYGPEGAAYVFAPQKGADNSMVAALDAGLRHFAEVSAHATGQDYSAFEGSGAAGGLGYAFRQFLGGRLERGVEVVLDAMGFDGIIEDSDLVITGEGRIDSQTLTGKTPFGVAQHALRKGVPVVAIGGLVEMDVRQALEVGFSDVVQTTPAGMPLEEAMLPENAADNVFKAVLQLVNNLGQALF